MKLFGSKRSGARLAKNRQNPEPPYTPDATGAVVLADEPAPSPAPVRKKKGHFKGLAIFLAIVLVLELAYFFCIYTTLEPISTLRSIYIETAMDTLSHKWLANLVIPYDVVAKVADSRLETMMGQVGHESQWGQEEEDAEGDLIDAEVLVPAHPSENTDPDHVDITVTEPVDPEKEARDNFYKIFHEVDKPSFEAYLEAHPEVLENGWANLVINEAGLDDKGTDILTVQGEQVLALDVPNQILIVRIKGTNKVGTGYVGALAIAKDPSRLVLRPASTIWTAGQTVDTIASANDGVLGMTGSAFIDPEGGGNGGELAGYAMYNGVGDGYGHLQSGYKRIELRENNLFYIMDAPSPTTPGTTDAVEFGPALLIDGKVMVDANCGYTGMHPRAAIGQSDKHEILMLVIEGRNPVRSMGTDVIDCAEILKSHGGMQAMNLDGGTSAILWYDGEEVTVCSNQQTPAGRPMPTAWIYSRESVPTPEFTTPDSRA